MNARAEARREAADRGVALHPPGEPGRGAVLDVGLRCPHACRFCYYKMNEGRNGARPLAAADFRPGGELREILDLLPGHGLEHFDITGGEPSLHPDIVNLVRRGCAELGLAGRLITLGQFLLDRRHGGQPLADALVAAGLADFLFSMHAPDEASFAHATGGSLARLEAALDHLDRRGVQYGGNTVLWGGNVEQLPRIAAKVREHGFYVHNFILFNAYHGWNDTAKVAGMQARYAELAGPLTEAVLALDAAGLAVNVRYAPYCVLPGLEKHLVGLAGFAYDPFEWRNRACSYDQPPAYCAEPLPIGAAYGVIREAEPGPKGTRIVARRGDRVKVFPEKCAGCAAFESCDGVSPLYLERFGDGELTPYGTFPMDGPLPAARAAYGRAFRFKREPGADMLGRARDDRAAGPESNYECEERPTC